VYWNPRETLRQWELLKQQRWTELEQACKRTIALDTFLDEHFGAKGFTDTAYDHLGGAAFGFLQCGLRSRGPYVSATEQDVEDLRAWCAEHYPEILEQ
jgi:hypothetical protein